jgi:hypothetical protein
LNNVKFVFIGSPFQTVISSLVYGRASVGFSVLATDSQ